MASTSTFSSSGEDAITKTLVVKSKKTAEPWTTEFRAYYEIERTLKSLREGNFHRIALQFPDDLLHDSVPVNLMLKRELDASCEVYILADTSYGSCCVDEVAASHVDADVVVHYGHACMSQTSRLPVIYVFGQRDMDEDRCILSVIDYISSHPAVQEGAKLILKHDVRYWRQGSSIANRLHQELPSTYTIEYDPLPNRTGPQSFRDSSRLEGSRSTNSEGQLQFTHSLLEEDPTSDEMSSAPKQPGLMLWIGDESPTLTKYLMTSEGVEVIAYSPTTRTIQPQSHLTNKLLMRRYATVQKARDADVFGILVGTLGVSSYLPLISHLRSVLKKAHKKSYTVSVGKINPAKLANFMEVECWVWVTCSEGMIDSKDFLRPIITPFELELALQPELSWTGKYVLDFETILAEAAGKNEEGDAAEYTGNGVREEREGPMFSLTTGKYRYVKRYGVDVSNTPPSNDSEIHTVALRNNESTLAKLEDSAAADFLQNRSYRGLDPRLGQDEPSVLEQGRSGIAREYSNADSNG